MRSDPRFGSVSNLSEDEMRAVFGERGGDPDRPGKKDPLDCLLWQAERPGEPAWDTALGRGRPGWHIECSAISLHHLGAELDVQGGGSDLVFPHHEMSASEAQAAFEGLTFARAYVHAGMVGYQGEKMSKSKGNLVLVSRLREAGVDPMAIRLALLAHHYRSDWEWTDADLAAAQERLAAWRAAVATARPASRPSRSCPRTGGAGGRPGRAGRARRRRRLGRRRRGDGSGAVRGLLDARLGRPQPRSPRPPCRLGVFSDLRSPFVTVIGCQGCPWVTDKHPMSEEPRRGQAERGVRRQSSSDSRRLRYRSNSRAMASPLASGRSAVSRVSSRART